MPAPLGWFKPEIEIDGKVWRVAAYTAIVREHDEHGGTLEEIVARMLKRQELFLVSGENMCSHICTFQHSDEPMFS